MIPSEVTDVLKMAMLFRDVYMRQNDERKEYMREWWARKRVPFKAGRVSFDQLRVELEHIDKGNIVP